MYFDVLPGNVKMRCTTAEIISRLRSFGININNEPRVSGRILNDTLAPMGLISDRWKINGIKVSGWCGIEPNGKTPLSNGF